MYQSIDLNNLDKSSWQSFNFEQIAQKISETVQPSKAAVEVYVGLEHIDSNNIHIRRKGVPSDVKGGKLRCFPGDVIFGKRRAYQRKAAIVDFEGICSAHAFVFRAIPEVIHPKLFPFFLHSDQFMHRMIDISVGGLSPTINWNDLRHQEFLLPPKVQQAEIAELLWAMDEVVQRDINTTDAINQYVKSYFYNFLKRLGKDNKVTLGEICKPKQWKTIAKKDITQEGYYVYGGNGIIGRFSEYNHENPVIAISCRGEYSGNVHYTKPKSYVTGNSMCLDDLDSKKFDKKFLFYVLFYSNLDPMITGSAQPQIIKSDVERYRINLVDMKAQRMVVENVDFLWELIEHSNNKIKSSSILLNSLVNKVFKL
ncbi:restriction endonuclease subunit S [Pseudomonadota bacterium]|nr:restriction endonuclease subunit S [Pseudomonadota bacterium]